MPEPEKQNKKNFSQLDITEVFPYSMTLVQLALFDLIEELHGQVENSSAVINHRASNSIETELLVYERVSRFAFRLSTVEEHCHVAIGFLTAAADLSLEGQERSLHYLVDALYQKIENALNETWN